MKEKTKKSILTFGIIGAGFIALMSLFKGKSSNNGYTGGGSGGSGVNFDVLSAVKPDLSPFKPEPVTPSSFDNISPYKPDSIDVGMDNLDINGNVNPPSNYKRSNIGTNDISDSGIVDENLYKNTGGYVYKEFDNTNPNDWYFTELDQNGFVARNRVTGDIFNTSQSPTAFLRDVTDPNSRYYNPNAALAIEHANQHGLNYAANPDKKSYEWKDFDKLDESKFHDNDDNIGSVGGAYLTQTVNRIMRSDDPYKKEIAKNTVELDQDLRKRGSSLEQAHEKHKPNLKGSMYKTEEEYWQAMGNIGKRH